MLRHAVNIATLIHDCVVVANGVPYQLSDNKTMLMTLHAEGKYISCELLSWIATDCHASHAETLTHSTYCITVTTNYG